MHRLRRVVCAVAATAALVAPLVAQTPDSSLPLLEASAELQPGDVIRVRVWREPDLSGDFTVDETDSVVIPKLGRISTANRSPAHLKDTLLSGYATYLRNPSVDVTFLRRITVLGAVKNPGLYTVDPTVTVVGALAMAGGATGSGHTKRVDLVRGAERVTIELDEPQQVAARPLRSGDQLIVPQRSWLSRNTWLVAVAISTTAGFIRLAID